MDKESAKVPDELIPNNKRNFFKKKYPIQKTKFIILVLAVALLIWNFINMVDPSDTLSDHYSNLLTISQPYKKSFVPLSVVNFFKGDPKTMTRDDCYNIMDSQSQSGLIPWDWSAKSRETASDLCRVTMVFSKSQDQQYGSINCQRDYFYQLESYYNDNHATVFVDSDDSLESIKNSSQARNIMLFIYDLFSFVVFAMMVWKINLNRIYLPSFFSIFNSQAHYNIVKILKKKQLKFQPSQNCLATTEKIMDALFFLFFLYITFVFPIYVIAQLGTVFSNAKFFCSIQSDTLDNYQSTISKLKKSTITEQQRGSSFFSSAFNSQYDEISNYQEMCSNSSSIVTYLFGSVRQTLISIQLLLIIVKAILNIITIIKKFCTKKFIDYYELRKDLNLHAVPFVDKKEIFPFSDDPSSVVVEDYNEQDEVSQQSAFSDATLNAKETNNQISTNASSTNSQPTYNPNLPNNAIPEKTISNNQQGVPYYVPPNEQNVQQPNYYQQQNYGNQNNMNIPNNQNYRNQNNMNFANSNNYQQQQNMMNQLNQFGQNLMQGLYNQFNNNQCNPNLYQQGNNQQHPS